MIYKIDKIPKFLEQTRQRLVSKKRFYSVCLFDECKQNNSNTSLVFEDFSATYIIDGFVLSKNEDELLATIGSAEKGIC